MRRIAPNSFWLGAAVLGVALLAEWARAWLLLADLSWGWAVPILCGYFMWLRWADLPAAQPIRAPGRLWRLAIPFGIIAAAARLWLEPFPGWPLMEWIYSLSMLALLGLLITAFEGPARARHCGFPLALGLVAIPWPALVTDRWIGQLRTALAGVVAEVLTWLQWPAVATGTTIETARGSVGIDEACGGIHSLQTAVLVGLAIGELRRVSAGRRIGWLASAVAIALASNALRIGFLAWHCAQGGPAEAAKWHDFAATAEMILILASLGALALLPGARRVRRVSQRAEPISPAPGAAALAYSIAGGIVLTEVCIALWFGLRLQPASAGRAIWPAQLPSHLATFEPEAYTDAMKDLLGADRHELGRWKTSAGERREAYLLEWRRGQRAQYVLRGHNPDICLGLSGSVPLARSQTVAVVDGRPLTFESRLFRRNGTEFRVYFAAWDLTDDRPLPWGSASAPQGSANAWSSRWQEIAAHRRSLAARVLAIAIYDAATSENAEESFRETLRQITASADRF